MVVVLAGVHGYSQETRWQVTHGSSLGVSDFCQLVSSSFKVTLHQFGMDVEEEAVIEATRPGYTFFGDSTTLEITGTFYMIPGTTVRSMLLWNGNTILKAKLKERATANEQYEKVVDRDKPRVIPRDPALIEYLGNGSYRYKIYPVALGGSRKIRILYTIPRSITNSEFTMDLRPAFLTGCRNNPNATVPVKIVLDDQEKSAWMLQNLGQRREIISGSTYLLSAGSWFLTSAATQKVIRFTAATPKKSQAEICVIPASAAAGTYIAMALSVDGIWEQFKPDSAQMISIIKEKLPNEASKEDLINVVSERISEMKEVLFIEAVIKLGSTSYVFEGRNSSSILALIKTEQEWDHKVLWNIYGPSGKVQSIEEVIPAVESSSHASLIPLIWASKYTLVDHKGSMGGLFGFVDEKMSLLALEEDVLAAAIAQDVAKEGVPPLLPSEIFAGTAAVAPLPEESILFEGSTGIAAAPADRLSIAFSVTVNGNTVQIISGELSKVKACSLRLFDLRGRLVFSSNHMAPSGNLLSVALPLQLKGRYVLRITGNGINLQKQITLVGR